MAYFYLIASLPPLTLDGPLPVQMEDFIASCETQMTGGDLDDLRLAASGRAQAARHPFLRAWAAGDTQLRNTLARIRANARKANAAAFIHEHAGYDVGLDRAAGEAMALDNPLERELALDRIRWNLLDELALSDPHGASPIFAFVLKLRIAARWRALTEEAGRDAFNAITAQILESAVEGKGQL